MATTVKFTKMHGAGNDYIYVDATKYPLTNPAAAAVKWSTPHTGIGSDGLVIIDQSDVADFKMRIFNADGSEATMCGNASRCIGKYVYERGLTQDTCITLETLSGIKTLKLHLNANDKVETVTVDMGTPRLLPVSTTDGACEIKESPITADGATYLATAIDMGNPHLVIFTDDISQIDLSREGSALEHHPLFPGRVNVEFAQVRDDGSIRMRVWERGSGITLACGTGACATAAAAYLTGRTGHCVRVEMDGGILTLNWDRRTHRMMMTGGATWVFDGEIEE